MQRVNTTDSSDALRSIGNQNYRVGMNARSVQDKRKYFWQALDKYKEAIEQLVPGSRPSMKCRSQGYKNLGVVNKELAMVEWQEGKCKRSWMHIHDSAESYANAALNCSGWVQDAADRQWQLHMMQQCAQHVQVMYENVLSCETGEDLVKNCYILCVKLATIRSSCVEFLEVAVAILVDVANRQLHLGISLHSQQQYVLAANHIADMHFPLREAERLSGRDEELARVYDSELQTLRTDRAIQDSIFRSRVELETAKSFLQNLDQDSCKWMDEALLACDHLRAALGLVSEEGLDIALEAEICSYLGCTHLKVLNSESTAKTLLHRTLELVLCFLSDTPQHCRDQTWYSAAERGLQDIQRKQAKRQDEERIKELTENGTLQKIKDNYDSGLDNYLEFIYKEFTFIGKSAPSLELSRKKRIVQALSHFHPDKANKDNRLQYWICEEVTKYLNVFHGDICM